jgi:predicted dehydrogenase
LFVQPRSDAVRTEQAVETIDTIEDELAEFARCIRDGGRPETGVAEALEVAAVIEAVGRSVETGCVVEVSDLR